MPKVSIITTTYKHEEFIKETINSVLAQSFTDWELLIGDDSPNDATWNMIQEYTEKYPMKIHAWHHIPNKWLVDNMNFLLLQVSPDSEYIAFLEWDDLYMEDCLSLKVNIFEEFPQVGIVYSDINFITKTSEVTIEHILWEEFIKRYQNKYVSIEEYIWSRNSLFISYSSLMIRMSLVGSHMPIQNITWSKTYAVSDYDFFLRVSRDCAIYGIQKSLTHYRRHNNNLSATYENLFNDFISLIDTYYSNKIISHKLYTQKRSWIYVLKSFSNLGSWDRYNGFGNLGKSIEINFFHVLHYKIMLFFLLLFPGSFIQRIIQQKIRRWTNINKSGS